MKFQYLDSHTLSHVLSTKVADPHQFAIIANYLRRVAGRLVHWLTSTDDIHIRQVIQSGEVVWMIFDRCTQTYTIRTSEAEVRSYLEHRYYQQ